VSADVPGEALLNWYETVRRPLPWRFTRDPWALLVSEVMLQQTQAARVVPHYERFLARFPTPAVCAEAPAAEVIAAWSGLGYNRRALALRAAAGVVAADGCRRTCRRSRASGPTPRRPSPRSRGTRRWPRSTPTCAA
jgi:A/G-specific adenine glycosylase